MLKARAMYGMFKTQTICIKIYTIFHCYLMSLSQNKKNQISALILKDTCILNY